MADRRTRGSTGPDPSRTTASRAAAIAQQLHHECSILLELYRKKETFPVEVTDSRLVSVPPPSSQLHTRDRLWRLHMALLQCRDLLARAIAKEEEELGSGKKSEYETQRKTVHDRLVLLLVNTGELVRSVDGSSVVTPGSEGLELDGLTLFELKVCVLRIFKEVDHWAQTAITTLQGLPLMVAKERGRSTRFRSTRSARR